MTQLNNQVQLNKMPSMLGLFLFYLVAYPTFAQDCIKRDYGNGGTVCVCNADHCDTIAPVEKLQKPLFLKYTSNRAGLRFKKENGTFSKRDEGSVNQIVINQKESYQEILGWGGAFTDAAGINIKSLSDTVQEKLMRSYFSEDGIEYSLCRVPIGGTDFSTHGYSYNDIEDKHLNSFNISHEDYVYKIPLIKQALNLTKNDLRLIASAWIAPKWMKWNKAYSGILGFLSQQMYQVWADYFIKFLDMYKNHNIRFWGITTGNEPSLAISTSRIPSVAWTFGQMRQWIEYNLGPTLRNSSHSDIKILALDDQRFFLPWSIDLLFQSKIAKNFVDGIAVHWYWDKTFPPTLLTKTHDKYPEKFILATEACRGDKFNEVSVLLGSWLRGEEYAYSIIEDVNHWVTGWLDWNMALDESGGPTYIANNVDSPIIVNKTADEFYKQPMYYTLGHFSKFVPRGSKKIYASQFDNNVPTTAFKRPDDGVVVVILNQKNEDISAVIVDDSRGEIKLLLTAHSLTSILYW